MRVLAVLALCVVAVCAQNEQAEEEQPQAVDPSMMMGAEALIMMQVQQEEMMARRYTEAILKLQHSQMDMTAASMWMHQAFQKMSGNSPITSFLQVDDDDEEEDALKDLDFGDDEFDVEEFDVDELDQPSLAGKNGNDDDDDDDDVPSFDDLAEEHDDDTPPSFDDLAEEHDDDTPPSFDDLAEEYADGGGDVFDDDYLAEDDVDDLDVDDLDVDDLDVDDLDEGDDVEVEVEIDEDNKKELTAELLASYHLFRGIGLKTYQTIYQAGDLQREFYMDRVMQLRAQSTPGLPPQLLQILYMKQYSTTLKTMKLAYAFQMISTYKTWLEDAMDVYGSVLAGGPNAIAVFQDHEDDLLRHRLWAFSAFNSYAMLDFQLFYIEYYMEMTIAQIFGGAPVQASSFVQEEMKEGVEAEPSQFMPFMGMMQNPAMMLKLYKMYHAMYQAHAARSGLFSAFMDQKAYQMLKDGDADNDDDADKLSEQANMMFSHGFAHGLFMTSQIEYITGIFELYSMYAPVAAPQAKASN